MIVQEKDVPNQNAYGTSDQNMVRVLFVCTHNSARSQMAEGLMRHIAPDNVAVSSAGTHPTSLHPLAITTLESMGIDIRQQAAKHVSKFENELFDYVITVCDSAHEVCPQVEGASQLKWGLTDPVDVVGYDEKRAAFQRVALQLKTRIEHLLVTIKPQA